MVHLSAGQVRYLGEELEAIDGDKSDYESQVTTRAWDNERDRLSRIAKNALDAAVQERAVRVAERTGAAIADTLRRIFFDEELALSPEQRDCLPALLRCRNEVRNPPRRPQDDPAEAYHEAPFAPRR